tara:strand:+ start:272 stop:658 length:387 start_codon:yes stop_codon:yes gene_type:complete
MKYIHLLNKLILILLIIGVFSFFLTSKTNANEIEDLKKITSKLRCMTCQNQSIFESDTDFSKDIKKIVLERLKDKKTEEEIIAFLAQRYGEYILFEPQMNKKNVFLWYFPFLFLALSLFFLIFRIRKN